MPIGDQEFGDVKLTAAELKQHYDDLIKEVILKADPLLKVARADEVSLPGSITQEILTRLMHSDIVIADVTYPNPNVFYELGIRHACRVGTIIIRDKKGPKIPFDIAHLRHIEYDNTPSGLKTLTKDLHTYFEHFRHHPNRPDNQLLELAKLTNYAFPNYKNNENPFAEFIDAAMQSPEYMKLFMRSMCGEKS